MSDANLTGGCLCHAVRYRVEGPALEVCHCHCQMCRKIHGALFASFAVVKADRFRITEGEEKLTCYGSSPGVRRYFCATCGGQVYSELEQTPTVVFFTVGSLDQGVHPGHEPGKEQHIFVGSKIPWHEIRDDLPPFEEW